MKIIILRTNLKSGLDSVGRAVGTNLNLPILGNVLIKAGAMGIVFIATNLEIAVRRKVLGKVVEDGEVAVPYQTIFNIVNNIASERIDIESDGKGGVILKTENYKAHIQGMDTKEFPIIPEIKDDKKGIKVDIQNFKPSLTQAVVAGEVSNIRPEISGVLFQSEKNTLTLAATDSFRLSEVNIQTPGSTGGDIKATVPMKAADELIRITGEEGEILMKFSDNQAFFETEEYMLTTRLIDGDFPDYKPIIPKETDTEIVVKRSELINAIKLTGSFAGKTQDIHLKTQNKKILEVYSKDNSIGEGNYLVPAKISGPDIEISFNWKYLLDGLRSDSSEQVFIGLNTNDRPAIIRTPENKNAIYILMPTRSV